MLLVIVDGLCLLMSHLGLSDQFQIFQILKGVGVAPLSSPPEGGGVGPMEGEPTGLGQPLNFPNELGRGSQGEGDDQSIPLPSGKGPPLQSEGPRMRVRPFLSDPLPSAFFPERFTA